MGKVKQYKNRITRFLQSDNGQRFFNFAYSIGAAIVIWGALFKILHLPGGNILLSLGMGTEVLMFILSAFDRPPREYHWEEVFPAFADQTDEDDETAESVEGEVTAEGVPASVSGAISGTSNGGSATVIVNGGTPAGGTIVVGGGGVVGGVPASGAVVAGSQGTAYGSAIDSVAQGPTFTPAVDVATATQQYLDQMNSLTAEMEKLHNTTAALNKVSDILLESYRAITENSEEITRSSRGYVDQMTALNRNVSGLNTIYEIQLKSVSSQIDSIDRVNRGIKDIRDMYEKSSQQSERYVEETEKMARYMQQLNSVYEKMITAMTVNMYHPGMPGAAPAANPSENA